MLDVWPAFPLFIHDAVINTRELDNTIAVLERSDRAYHIILTSYMENILATMLKPFSELTYLGLISLGAATVIPDSFLGGSAPRLQSFSLHGILFPGLPNLFLSAPHLVNLSLSYIPRSGYISPEGIITALSTLTSLRRLSLAFESPRSFPDQRSRHPPPLTRTVLPALRALIFKGLREYLEDLVALIDAPRLCFLSMTLFNQIFFNTPQSIHFFCHTTRLKAFKIACLVFKDDGAAVVLSPALEGTSFAKLEVKFLYRDPVLQVLSVEQVCITCLPPLPALEDLYIYEDSKSPPDWRDNVENTRWLDLLRPFPAVKNLYLSEEFALRIGPALQELVESRTMELLRNYRISSWRDSSHRDLSRKGL